MYVLSQRHDPAEERAAYSYIHIGAEMVFINRNDKDIFSETVDQDSDHVVYGFKGHIDLFTAVHSEKALCISRGIELLEDVLSQADERPA